MSNRAQEDPEFVRLRDCIFNDIFPCRLRQIDTVSEYELKSFGFFSVGNKTLDDITKNSLVDVFLSINAMVEYFKQGVVIRVSTETSKTLYDIIHPYLHYWLVILQDGINVSNAPIEDLKALDDFAAVIYPHATQLMTDTYVHSQMIEKSKSYGFGFNRDGMFSNINIDEKPKDTPIRESLSNALVSGLAMFRNNKVGG